MSSIPPRFIDGRSLDRLAGSFFFRMFSIEMYFCKIVLERINTSAIFSLYEMIQFLILCLRFMVPREKRFLWFEKLTFEILYLYSYIWVEIIYYEEQPFIGMDEAAAI